LEGTRWVLDSIDDGTSSVQVLEGTEPFLEFDGETVSGSDGCNSFNGGVTVGPDDAIAFGQMAGTMMACEEAITIQATAINAALAGVITYQVDGDQLTLSADDGTGLVYGAG
ncbi:MAG: META domain-containing protein, partial [Actinobacteria bacterium]